MIPRVDYYSRAGTTRHLLHPKSPWLYFHRDHPLRHDNCWRIPTRDDGEDFCDQEERLAWILALPDDDELDVGSSWDHLDWNSM
jgi:hypothetical protein